jgi:hypothetical protein
MTNSIKTFKVGNLTVNIDYDLDPQSPRTWAETRMVYTSTSLRLGDKRVSHEDMEDIKEKIESGELLGRAVYAYSHGGTAVSTKPFSCAWDSGQCGFIYVVPKVKQSWLENAEGDVDKCLLWLESEVEEFNQFLNGQVYGYDIEDEDGDVVDSCWGIYGLEYCESEARSTAETILDSNPQQLCLEI